jgi:hypothetical protein
MHPGELRVAHKNGRVILSTIDIDGKQIHVGLDPVAAITHAQQVMHHADLAREQQHAEQAKTAL